MSKRSLPNPILIEQLDQAVSQLMTAPVATVQSANPELMPLLNVAAQLRGLPREDFKARIKPPLPLEMERYQQLSDEVVQLNRKLNYTYGGAV